MNILAEEAALSAAHAAWVGSIATVLMLFVTALAAWFGVRAAQAASKTYRLESDPVISIDRAVFDAATFIDRPRSFVLDGTPTVDKGIELRDIRDNDTNHPNWKLSNGHQTVLSLYNAGRSPALAVILPVTVTLTVAEDFRDVEKDDFPAIREKTGEGTIAISGVGANASAKIQVFNLLGNYATLSFADRGECIRVDDGGKKPARLAVVAMESFVIRGAS